MEVTMTILDNSVPLKKFLKNNQEVKQYHLDMLIPGATTNTDGYVNVVVNKETIAGIAKFIVSVFGVQSVVFVTDLF
jgi:hypothetical protein